MGTKPAFKLPVRELKGAVMADCDMGPDPYATPGVHRLTPEQAAYWRKRYELKPATPPKNPVDLAELIRGKTRKEAIRLCRDLLSCKASGNIKEYKCTLDTAEGFLVAWEFIPPRASRQGGRPASSSKHNPGDPCPGKKTGPGKKSRTGQTGSHRHG